MIAFFRRLFEVTDITASSVNPIVVIPALAISSLIATGVLTSFDLIYLYYNYTPISKRKVNPDEFAIPDASDSDFQLQVFRQSELITLFNEQYSSLKLGQEGICHGLAINWLKHAYSNKDFLYKIQEIVFCLKQKIALFPTEIRVIKSINEAHQNQPELFGRNLVLTQLYFFSKRNNWLEHLEMLTDINGKETIQGALRSLLKKSKGNNTLAYLISLKDMEYPQAPGHKIALLKHSDGTFKFFDANYGEITTQKEEVFLSVCANVIHCYVNKLNMKTLICGSVNNHALEIEIQQEEKEELNESSKARVVSAQGI